MNYEADAPIMTVRAGAVNTTRSQKLNIMDKVATVAAMAGFFAILYGDVFSGVLRYLMSSAGAPLLIYAPFVIGLAAWTVHAVARFLASGDLRFGAISLIFAILVVVSLMMGRPAFQVYFGLWAWIPFVVGLMAIASLQWALLSKHLVIAMVVACAGVILHKFVPLPWTGQSYDIFGTTVDTTRVWNAWGVVRVSGFSRISDAAAAQISIGCYVALASRLTFIAKLIVWLISVTCVYWTTSKTPLAAVLLAPVFAIVMTFFRSSRSPHAGLASYAFILTITAILLIFIILPPLNSQFIVDNMDVQAGSGFLRLRSMFDRAYFMWPASLGLLERDGNQLHLMLGRGLGGVGAPLLRGEGLIITADNLFVFTYVCVGVFSVLLVPAILSGYRRLLNQDRRAAAEVFCMSVGLLIVAATNATVEAPYMCLALGLLAGKALLPRGGNAV